jgi:hypothetical protein
MLAIKATICVAMACHVSQRVFVAMEYLIVFQMLKRNGKLVKHVQDAADETFKCDLKH